MRDWFRDRAELALDVRCTSPQLFRTLHRAFRRDLSDPRGILSCRHLYAVRVQLPMIDEYRCELKNDDRKMLEMSERHAAQVGGTATGIGKKCPFAESDSFSVCEWSR